jgi:cytidyltransferase-like protein
VKYSLFIGRFQPPHDGHVAIIKKLLKEGKNVVVGLKKADYTKDNPYGYIERVWMLAEKLRGAKGCVKVIFLPDVDEVVYGRKVGYKIRRVKLSKKMEAISSTKIRRQHG